MNRLIFIWSNTHQLFYMLGNIGSYRSYPNILFNRGDRVFQVSHGNRMSCYIGEEDIIRYVEEGKLFLDRSAAKRYIKKAKMQCANHQSFFSKLSSTDLSKSTNALLLNCWRGLIDNYNHSAAYFRSTQEEPSRIIVQTITQAISIGDAQKLLLSAELDAFNDEEIAWDKLVISGLTREKALKHLNNFPWLFQNSLSYQETIDELFQRARGYISRNIKKEKEELALEQNKILSRHPEIAEKVKTLQELALLRSMIKSCWCSTGFYALPLLAEISKRTKVDLKALVFTYLSEDIEALLENNKVLSKEELAERNQCTAYLFENGIMHTSVGKEAEKLEKNILESNLSKSASIHELKGMSARPGKVTGTVHILTANDPAATKKFRESFKGGVLVTSMTQPNVVDIVRKASAIITDEGSLLSHAAIISREFGIPCIVGTHFATQVLKDGMRVEVDADKGVVKII